MYNLFAPNARMCQCGHSFTTHPHGRCIECTCQHFKDYSFSVKPQRPKIVCLCGSTRFSETYQRANLQETLAGKIVLTIGCDMRADGDLFAAKSEAEREEIKRRLDELHLRKIDLADEVLVLNVGGYVGESTRREIHYAYAQGRPIYWWDPERIPPDLA